MDVFVEQPARSSVAAARNESSRFIGFNFGKGAAGFDAANFADCETASVEPGMPLDVAILDDARARLYGV